MECMKVLLASPRGFCAGVNMAIESLDLALGVARAADLRLPRDRPQQVRRRAFPRPRRDVRRRPGRSARRAPRCCSPPTASRPKSAAIARERNLRAIDATCPLVTKVHLEAIKYAQAGYTILLIGHEGHDEVIGTMGEAPEAIVLVESPEDVAALQVADERKVAYLTQTTLSVDDANRIIDRLKQRFPHIAGPPKDDICYATQNRQEAVSTARARSRRGARARQPEQLQQPAAGRAGPRTRHAGLSGRWPADLKPAWFDGVEHRPRHRRGQRAGAGRRRMSRLAPRAVRRNGRTAFDSPGKRVVPAAARTAKSSAATS